MGGRGRRSHVFRALRPPQSHVRYHGRPPEPRATTDGSTKALCGASRQRLPLKRRARHDGQKGHVAGSLPLASLPSPSAWVNGAPSLSVPIAAMGARTPWANTPLRPSGDHARGRPRFVGPSRFECRRPRLSGMALASRAGMCTLEERVTRLVAWKLTD